MVELLDPKRISALGVDIESTKRTVIHLALSAVILYLIVAFALAVRADYVEWRDLLEGARSSGTESRITSPGYKATHTQRLAGKRNGSSQFSSRRFGRGVGGLRWTSGFCLHLASGPRRY